MSTRSWEKTVYIVELSNIDSNWNVSYCSKSWLLLSIYPVGQSGARHAVAETGASLWQRSPGGEIVDMIDPGRCGPSRGRHGLTKIELFKTEKWMLIYGSEKISLSLTLGNNLLCINCVYSWGQWKDILDACDFRKRQLGVGTWRISFKNHGVYNSYIPCDHCLSALWLVMMVITVICIIVWFTSTSVW